MLVPSLHVGGGKSQPSMMQEPEGILRVGASSDHSVQLFDTPESLGEAVASFLAEGLEGGGRLLVAARAASVWEVSRGFADRGISMSDLVTSGRLTVVDAHATLRALLCNERPERTLFEAHVGGLVARLSAGSPAPLRIYGELVDILAEEGNFDGAAALEDLWNELRTVAPFALLCGYASGHFAAPNAGRALEHICARHGRVHQGHADLLGSWLLGQSRHADAV